MVTWLFSLCYFPSNLHDRPQGAWEAQSFYRSFISFECRWYKCCNLQSRSTLSNHAQIHHYSLQSRCKYRKGHRNQDQALEVVDKYHRAFFHCTPSHIHSPSSHNQAMRSPLLWPRRFQGPCWSWWDYHQSDPSCIDKICHTVWQQSVFGSCFGTGSEEMLHSLPVTWIFIQTRLNYLVK